MKRILVLMIGLGVAASCLGGCAPRKTESGKAGVSSDVASAHGPGAGGSAPTQPGGPPAGGMAGTPMGGTAGPPAGRSLTAAGGLTWTLPASWSVEAPRAMRVATYAIPAAAGDTPGAECAVYHFGAGQGGTVDANLDRWIGQFQPLSASKRWTRVVGGIRVNLVDVAGTYTAHGGGMGGGMGGTPSNLPGWRLLGAIAEGRQGSVFFKLAGPAKTVAAAKRDFEAMVGSLQSE